MKTIKKTYKLREITVQVNNRELLYDYQEQTVLYTYKNINKNHFKLTGKKWRDLLAKYKLWQDYVFQKYEEFENDCSRNK